MKHSKLFACVLSITLLLSIAVTANTAGTNALGSPEIEPMINKDVSVYLYTSGWSAIVSDNNWTQVNVTITNKTESPGWAWVRIVNGAGYVIGAERTVGPAAATQYPVDSGVGGYMVQGKAEYIQGTYYFNIQD